jgi:O-antigen biosynthesis protein WbqP
MKRCFDLCFTVAAMIVFIIPFIVLGLLVKTTSSGPLLYWSDRVGRGNRIFSMPKLRTMRTDTPEVATHLLTDPEKYVTSVGSFLRTSSLDELPQLWSILRGDMSIVGPRPALFNQYDLIEMRNLNGIQTLMPGLTGWAQINGRDDLPISQKVALDREYLEHRSLAMDVRIVFLTFIRVVRREGVRH